MKIKSYRHFVLLALGFIITIIAYWFFVHSSWFPRFTGWAHSNIVLLSAILVLIKIAGIVWPPIPGGLFTLGSIPVLGWPLAYVLDLTGNVIGSVIAYYLAKKYGLNFVRKVLDEKTVEKIQRTKVVPERELEAIALTRMFWANISEIICYAAGLLGVKFRNFFLGTLIASLAFGIPLFYLISNVLRGNNLFLTALPLIVGTILFILLRKRYFTRLDTHLPGAPKIE
jgi:uncharacterized membrane protein YdjX (TVP38/TMEM64 family)